MRAGSYLLGVRSNTREADRLVARVLAGRLVEDVEAPPNYSLRMSSAGRAGQHRLLEGQRRTLVRTRSMRRLLWALCAFLDSHAAEQDSAAVHVDALVLVRDGRALLLPPVLRHTVLAEDELRRLGFRVLDAPTAALDRDNGDVVVPPPALVHGETTLDSAIHDHDPAEEPTVRPGRYPVRLWADLPDHGESRTPSRAVLVGRANRRVRNRAAVGPQAALSALARAASNAHLVAVDPTRYPLTVLEQLAEVLDDPAREVPTGI